MVSGVGYFVNSQEFVFDRNALENAKHQIMHLNVNLTVANFPVAV